MPPSSTQTTLMPSAVGTWYRLIPPPTEGAIVGEEVALADGTSVIVWVVCVCVYSECWCLVLVVLVEVVVKCRVTILEDDSGPEGEEATDEEAEGTEVDREVYCERRGPVLVVDTRGVMVRIGQCSLTDPLPGG